MALQLYKRLLRTSLLSAPGNKALKIAFSGCFSILFGLLLSTNKNFATTSGNSLDSSLPTNVSISDIRFKSHQLDVLSKDYPIQDVIFTPNKNIIFAGQTSLWFYDRSNQALKRIKVGDHQSQKTSIHSLDRGVYLLRRDNQVFKIKTSPTIKISAISFEKDEKILDLSVQGKTKDPIVLSNKALYKIDINADTNQSPLQKINLLPKVPARVKNIKIGPRFIWFYSDKNLWRWHPLESSIEKIAKDILSIQDLDFSGDKVLLQTNYSVIALNQDTSIDQTIPVSSTRKLIDFGIFENHHTFLFNDKQLEIYSTAEKKISYSKLNIGRIRKVNKIIFSRGFLVGIFDGRVQMFQLEGEWK